MHVSDVYMIQTLSMMTKSPFCNQAITEMVRQLRKNNGKTGLILANGGLATYEAVLCLSRSPRRDGLPYPTYNPLPEVITDVQIPPVDDQAEGDAVIEVSRTFRASRSRQRSLTVCRRIL